MIDFFWKEFEVMCFVKDTSILTGVCKFETAVKKFGEHLVKKCMYEKKLIFVDKRSNGLEWTDYGKSCIGI